MCRVIAVSNQKGGVGKTVSCVNLGIGLAQEGKKVLLIDADPQGSLTISLGYEEPDEMEYSLATLMLNCIFRKNRALAPHERSAVPLGTDHCPVG